jgi:hypothetical protein
MRKRPAFAVQVEKKRERDRFDRQRNDLAHQQLADERFGIEFLDQRRLFDIAPAQRHQFECREVVRLEEERQALVETLRPFRRAAGDAQTEPVAIAAP